VGQPKDTSPTGFVVVANEAAGSTEQAAVDTVVTELEHVAPVEVRRTGHPDEVDEVLRALDGRTLVVLGGDGSLHLALSRLHAAGRLGEVPVGYVALGTGNDFARGAGIPLDPAAAASAISEGDSRAMDLIVARDADGHEDVVVNVAHAGVGAEAAMTAATVKRYLGRLAYVAGALHAGLRYRGFDVVVTVDGRPVDGGGRALMVAIGNGRTIGGGTAVTPAASADDGRLEVVVARPRSAGERRRFATALRSGRHLDLPFVHSTSGVEVTLVGSPVRHNVDGEVGPPLTERAYSLRPRAWTLVGRAPVPASSSANRGSAP
jgi:diacylglycerol kinase family enzyme